MLKKKIKYEDYDGNVREEDFYFNLSKAEILKMEMTTTGGLEATLNKIISEQNIPALYTYFEQIVQKSFGVKSPDGKYFDKDPEALKRFVQSPAYDELIMELVGDAGKAADFCNGIIPRDVSAKISQQNITARPGQAPIAGVIAPNT